MPAATPPNNIKELIERMAANQRVAILMLKSGERHHLKIVAIHGDLVVGEARGLHHSHEIGRRIHQHALEEERRGGLSLPGGLHGLTMADAIEKFGGEAHRFSFYVALDQIHSVAEDADDIFDETPYFPGLL